MGKSKVKNVKRAQRIAAVAEEVETAIGEKSQNESYRVMKDDELFHVDTGLPSTTILVKEAKKGVSAAMKRAIAQQAKKLKATGVLKTKGPDQIGVLWGVAPPVTKVMADPYLEPFVVKSASLKRVVSTAHEVERVKVAQPGQSYHPTLESHQDVIAEAVAQEIERIDRIAKGKEPVSKGLSSFTKPYIVDEEDSLDEDDDDEMIICEVTGKKIGEKFTKTKRNKMARRFLREKEERTLRANKVMTKGVNSSNLILSEIIKDERDNGRKSKLLDFYRTEALKDEPLPKIGGKRVALDRQILVALSDELSGSLRCVKPKGSVIGDRYDSLHVRNMFEKGGKKQKTKGPNYKMIVT